MSDVIIQMILLLLKVCARLSGHFHMVLVQQWWMDGTRSAGHARIHLSGFLLSLKSVTPPPPDEKFNFALITASKAVRPEQYLHGSLHAVIQLSSTPPIHQYELW